MQRSNVWSASTIIGARVQNISGDYLGKIEDLVIDPGTGRLQYAVLSFGGSLGTADKLFAIPWESFSLSGSGDHYVLNVASDILRDAPGFDRSNWPDMADPVWQSRTLGYYGRPYGYTQRAQTVREREIVVEREPRRPAKQRSLIAAVLMLVMLVGLLWFAYRVSTAGWEQARNEALNSFNNAAYAMKETSGDAALTAKIQTAFSLNKRIPAGAKINVDSQDGLVTIRGEVTSEDTRSLAETIARDTPGVREVRNHLYVLGSQ